MCVNLINLFFYVFESSNKFANLLAEDEGADGSDSRDELRKVKEDAKC
jgi:hypothetical protein